MGFYNIPTHLLHHGDHFGIEIANPIHFQVFVTGVGLLDHITYGHDERAIYSFALVFRRNAEYQPYHFFVGLHHLVI